MIHSLYELFVPKSIRKKIYSANVRQYELSELKRRSLIQKSAGRVELSSVYVANLRIVIDKDAFFDSMPKEAIVAQLGIGQDDINSRIMLITQPKRLHLVDAWENQNDGSLDILRRQYKQEMALDRLIINHGNPAEEIKGFDDGYLDWIYLNTDFSYEFTSEVLETCSAKIKEGGLIAGNNYARGSWLYGARYGVIEAVHEFCKKRRWEMIYLTHESCRQLSYAIRRIEPVHVGK